MDRRGTRVGALGLFQNFADGIKTLLRRSIIPKDADKKLSTWFVIRHDRQLRPPPRTGPMERPFLPSQLRLALLVGLAVFSLAPFFMMISGWASNNKYTVIGGMRAAAQLIAYEVPCCWSSSASSS